MDLGEQVLDVIKTFLERHNHATDNIALTTPFNTIFSPVALDMDIEALVFELDVVLGINIEQDVVEAIETVGDAVSAVTRYFPENSGPRRTVAIERKYHPTAALRANLDQWERTPAHEETIRSNEYF